MKKCNGPCGLEKEDKEFNVKRYKSGHIGLRAYCKICSHESRKTWRASSSKDNDRNKAYNKLNAARIRGHKLRKYWPGSTAEQANEMFELLYKIQDGGCAICKRVSKRLVVDHHHGSGVVRGLLCNSCNRALGYLQDCDLIIMEAGDYVRKHKP